MRLRDTGKIRKKIIFLLKKIGDIKIMLIFAVRLLGEAEEGG